MDVKITKKEGYKPYVRIMPAADELAYEPETVDVWIRQLRCAKAWLTVEKKKTAMSGK